MNEQLSDLRADAAAQAEAAAQAKVQENLEAAKEAIRFSWFSEFDPADEEAAWARLTAEIAVLGTDQREKVYLSDAPNGKRKTYDEGRRFFYGASVAVPGDRGAGRMDEDRGLQRPRRAGAGLGEIQPNPNRHAEPDLRHHCR